MDHILKEYLDEIKENQEIIMDDLDLIKEKLGISESDDNNEDDNDDKDLDF